jgi:hypothetical protein
MLFDKSHDEISVNFPVFAHLRSFYYLSVTQSIENIPTGPEPDQIFYHWGNDGARANSTHR